jgi:WD40 repeat protein
MLAAAGQSIALLDAATFQEAGQPLTGIQYRYLRAFNFSADGRWLAGIETIQTASQMRVWDLVTRQGVPLTNAFGAILIGCISPDGNTVAAGGEDGLLKLWDRASGRDLPWPATGTTESVHSIVFTRDSRTLAFAQGDAIRLADLSHTVKEVTSFRTESNSDTPCVLTFSPDGRTLATGSFSGPIELWDVPSRRRLRILHGHRARIKSLAFFSDGQSLLSGSEDTTVRLWKLGTRAKDTACTFRIGAVVAAAGLSPDATILATASLDSRIRLWDRMTQTERRVPSEHRQRISALAYSPDATILASASADNRFSVLTGEVKLWHAASGASF